jgi:hypothetical protein
MAWTQHVARMRDKIYITVHSENIKKSDHSKT